MKNNWFKAVALLLILVFALAGCGAPADDTGADGGEDGAGGSILDGKTTFVVGLDDSFPPMGFRDDDNNIVGFDVDLAAEVASRLGLELVLQPIVWANKELELNNGNIDCIWNGLSVTDERKETMLLTPAYLENAQIVVVAKDSGIESLADLAGKTVGLQEGSTAENAWTASAYAESAGSLVKADENVTLLTDLAIGRIDAVVMDKVVAEYYITTTDDTLMVLDEQLEPEMYAIAFKVGNDEMADLVIGALNDMVADGTMAEISTKWFGEDITVFPKAI